MSGNTWIEVETPERLEVRHKAGRLKALMFLTFGGFAAAYAFIEPGGVRWAAAAMAILNVLVAWYRTSLVTIAFDRDSQTVTCSESRPFLNHQASLPLNEFISTELRPSVAGGDKKALGFATQGDVFLPIDPKFSPAAAPALTQTIDDWLAKAKAEDSQAGS